MSTLLDGLNEPQRAAVAHAAGPLLIFAGAGSGKTRTLTHRIAHLMAGHQVPASRILAVTFTNRAANEMRERLAALVGPEARRIWMGTFHAMCAQMLRISGSEIGIDSRFVIFDSDDSLRLMKEILKDANIDSERYPAARVLHIISDAKNNLQSAEDRLSVAASPNDKTIARLFGHYSERLRACNALDFDDLLGEAVRLLRESPRAHELWSERFLHVLVDEFQDVNTAQFAWAQALASRHRNICVVGDDDQSIYAWRGANVKIILDFERTYPDAAVIRLEQNYRSTQNILDAAHGVISRNQGRAPKRLWTDVSGGATVLLHGANNAQAEAFWIVSQVQDQMRERDGKLHDFAILCRVNAQSRPFEEAFMRARVPLRLVGTQRFYERKEIKDLVGYLKLLYNPRDDIAMTRIINVPARGIGGVTIQKLAALAASSGRPLSEIVCDRALTNGLGTAIAKKLAPLRELLETLQAESRELSSVADLLAAVIEHTDYLDHLRREKTVESIDRMANVQELLGAASDFDMRLDDEAAAGIELSEEEQLLRGGESRLGLFLESSALEGGSDGGAEGDAVTLMTLHSAKGLEFPIVFLAGMEQGLLPHVRALRGEGDNDDDLEEERRLCYVGLTRARERVILTYAGERTLHGRTEPATPSQFLDEIPKTVLQRSGLAKSGQSLFRSSTTWDSPSNNRAFGERGGTATATEPARNIGAPPFGRSIDELLKKEPPAPPTFALGQRVRHAKFGEGLVVACSDGRGAGEWVEVAFLSGEVGKKRLGVLYAGLEKVG